MYRKGLLLVIIFVVICLAFGSFWLARAETNPSQISQVIHAKPTQPGVVSPQNPSEIQVPEVALGQPGLSYRYVKSFGTVGIPYLADTTRINRPLGLFMDGSNSIFITEEQSHRVLKFNSSKTNLLALGTPGLCEGDNRGFCNLQDVAVDLSGNFWVVDAQRVVQYNSAGAYLQQFPATDAWMAGSGNDRFDDPNGIAFDSLSRMFVSDRLNQRIQVFDLSSGTPVYSATIGATDVVSSTVGYFNQPMRIAVDSANRLLVADQGNNRVQRCTYSVSWSCTVLDSGLNQPRGVAVDGSNNVYIADTDNNRIRRCTAAGVCSNFVTEPHWYTDVAVDSSGRIYGAVPWEDIVVQFSNTGTLMGIYIGEQFVPYLTDGYHYWRPRVAIDNANNIIILEENGQRLVKLDANGTLLWTYGVPGVDMGWTNDHFQYPHGVAVDPNNNIYVADACRVQIFSPAGVYQSTLGGPSCGTGNYQFNWATGIAVDNNNNIYVVDYPNHRVMVYNSSKTYIGQIGETGVCNATNDHLCIPIAAETDSAGNIYITDAGNGRVQKFNSNRVWQMTIGSSTVGSFDQFSWAEDVAVDGLGRIFITDWNNNLVQVFDSSGKFLTTIGGEWGTNSSQFKGVPGVDVDSFGNVYVADWDNAVVKKFSPGVPGWQQANINGFGNRNNGGVTALKTFSGYLYAAAANWSDGGGAVIYRSLSGKDWTAVTQPGFGLGTEINSVIQMLDFNGKLYAGSGWSGNSGRIWRSTNGTDWSVVLNAGNSDADNQTVDSFVVFQNQIYASVSNFQDGLSIYRSDTGDNGTWTPVVTGGNGNAANTILTCFTLFNNELYAGIQNSVTGGQIWKTTNGVNWIQVNPSGFGTANNVEVISLVAYKGKLYAGTVNETSGADIWSSSNGTTWNSVMMGGLGDSTNIFISLYVFKDDLFAITNNDSGSQIWSSKNGINWVLFPITGYGDSNNTGSNRSNPIETFNGSLYVGTWNGANGGEIWMKLHEVYLPLTRR